MTAVKPPAPPTTILSGFCGVGRHQQCRGAYGGFACRCDCHLEVPEPEPEPLPEDACRECTARPAACVAARVKCCPDCTHTAEHLCPVAVLAVRRLQDVADQLEADDISWSWAAHLIRTAIAGDHA